MANLLSILVLLLAPRALSQTLAQALNTTNLVWTTGGNAVWLTQTTVSHDGLAAESGPIGDSQETWLETTVTNHGTLFFWWKVDSDWYTEYPNIIHADWLEFYVNGVLQDRIKGKPDWQWATVYCGAPTNVLRWRYVKDEQYAFAADRGWLDQVSFTPDPMTPFWMTQPRSQRVVEGGTVTFSSKAVGTPPIAYQWRFNNGPLTDATNASLTLTNLAFARSGPYSVWASNSVGLLSSNAQLTVLPGMTLTNLGEWPGFERSQALCVALKGNHAYVGLRYWTSYGAFLALDISNPVRPELLANVPFWDDEPQELFVRGDYVYVARGEGGLTIMDVSNPAQPFIAGDCDTPEYAQGVYVLGDVAYVADSYSGLQVINVANPALPVPVGSCALAGDAYGVIAAGNFAYVANGYAGFSVVTVTNPSQPLLVANLPLDDAYKVKLAGSAALVAAGNTGLVAIDVGDPFHPAYRSTNAVGWMVDVKVSGNRAVVPRDRNLDLLDISDPFQPLLLGTVGLPDYPEAVAVDGNRAVVADWEAGLQILDISNPTQPANIGEYDTDGYAQGLCLSGNFAFLADAQNGLQVLDISDPLHPKRAGRCNTPDYAVNVDVVGNLAYVADSSGGVQVVDWTDPTQPVLLGAYTNLNASEVQVVGNYAYVAAYTGGMKILDISDPRQPRLAGATTNLARADGIRVAGTFAYVVGGSSLYVVDCANPAQPVRVAEVTLPDHSYNLSLSDNYAYVGAQAAGLAVVDIHNPLSPALVGQCDTASYAAGLQLLGGYAFVGDWGDGLQVIDVTDPTLPAIVGGSPAPTDVFDARVAGRYAFLAQGEYGLGIKRLPAALGADPSITVSPSSRTVQVGDSVTFAVTAAGSPPLMYRWLSNNVALAAATNWVLCLTNIQPAQAGGYSVIVSNTSGSATSALAVLSVTGALPRPVILVNDGGFGFRTNQFGFNVRASAGQVVVIQASTNLATWVPVQTNLVTLGQFIFSDSHSGLFPRRFYRASLHQGSLPPPAICVDAALGFQAGHFGFNMAGVAGQTVAVEASTNLLSWTSLATNTLTPAPLYFSDPSPTGLPRRFYRLRLQ